MSPLGKRRIRRRTTRSLAAAIALLGALVAGCGNASSGSSNEPNTAGDATAVPGNLPGINQSTQGDISVSGVSLRRTGDQLVLSATIRNSGSVADSLLTVSSQVSTTVTFSPPLAIAAQGTVSLGGTETRAVLTVNARLEPGGTVALILNFAKAGAVDAYATP